MHPHLVVELFAGSETAGPEIRAEFEFQASEGCRIHPGLAIDRSTDDGAADASTSSNFSHPELVGEDSKFDGEQTGDLRHTVGAFIVRPIIAETPRCLPDGTRHVQSIRVDKQVTLHSMSTKVTDRLYTVLSKQHSDNAGVIVAEHIERYSPLIPDDHWDAIGDFVRSSLTDTKPAIPRAVRDSLRLVTALTHWAWQRGYELDRNAIFDRFTIEEFIAVGDPSNWSNGTRRNAHTQLFNVSQALLGAEARIPRLNPLPGDSPSKPYSADELVALRSWANSQATPTRRRDAMVLLALGAGAGLRVKDFFPLRRRDVIEIGNAVVVNVGGRRPRQVPVLAEWERDLLEAISVVSPNVYAFSQRRTGTEKNTVTHFTSSTSGVFKAQSPRLRATWLVHHLTIGTPIKPFLAAAGVYSSDVLTRYLQFIPDVDVEVARRLLRGR